MERDFRIAGYHSHKRRTDVKKHGRGTDRYYGIEIETEYNSTNAILTKNESAKCILDILGKDWGAEYDGSLNDGIEFVSPPMTLKYLTREIKTKWGKVARWDGYSLGAEDYSTTGMHIHVSRDALQRDTPFKLTLLVNTFVEDTVRLSQRGDMYDLAKFASPWVEDIGDTIFEGLYNDWEMEEYTAEDLQVYYEANCNDTRYRAINDTNRDTVELRIFAGTMSPRKIIGRVQIFDHLINVAESHTADSIFTTMTKEDLWAGMDKSYKEGWQYLKEVGIINC